MTPSRFRRTDRIAALVLREVSRIVREEVRDPRIGFVTFTGADISPDLGSGRVFVSVMGSETEKRESIAGLQSASPFIRNQLWAVLDLKTVPELTFELDRTLERAARIDEILGRIHEEAADPAAADPQASGAPDPGRAPEPGGAAETGGGEADHEPR